jgi:hypothetical protein
VAILGESLSAMVTRRLGSVLSRLAVVAVSAAWVAAIAWVAASALPWSRARDERSLAQRPIEVRQGGYVSSKTCQSCHPGEHATWHGSYHRRMTQVARPESIVAPFDGVELAVYGEEYRLEQRGDELWVERSAPGSSPREYRVALTTGSHHFEAYWLESGERRKVALFPFTYQIAEQRWIPFDALMLQPPGARQAVGEGGTWNRFCIHRHTTRPSPRALDPDGMDSMVAEFGIACEACHGPGDEHIGTNRNPLRRYLLHLGGRADSTIVQPGRLPHAQRSQVCGQCHSVREPYPDDRVRDWMQNSYSYRPGDDLFETRTIAHEDGRQTLTSDIQTRFWSDGEVRVNGREYNSLLRSPCHQRGDLSCFSCHRMHQAPEDPRSMAEWANDQLDPEMDGPRACLQCHTRFEDESVRVAHTRHARESSGSDCLNCHMPYTAWGLQKATRSHEVDSPTATESIETGRPNACNLCHLDRTLAWTASRLEEWYEIPAPDLGERQQSIAAGVLWLVSGDAGQRALIAWHMGWEPAQQASGSSWMAPYLAFALEDPYAAIRSVAQRSLRGLDGFEELDVDLMAPPEAWQAAIDRAAQLYWQTGAAAVPVEARDPLLLNESGGLRMSRYEELFATRNDRKVYLME